MQNPIEYNAYRILGLDTAAGQKEILRRYKEIINRLKIQDAPKYELDLGLLDNARSEESVKGALKALQSSKNNIREYFFWFRVSNSNDKKAIGYLVDGDAEKAIRRWGDLSNSDSPASYTYRKNLAILYCLLLSKDDNPKYLKDSIKLWKDIINSEKFWADFSKGYTAQNGQTASQQNLTEFRFKASKEISDVYTYLGKIHKNPGYVKTFQETFGVHGEATEKDLLQPVYQKLYDKINVLNNIKITDDGEQLSDEPGVDICTKCGTTKSKDYWVYDDGSLLCDNCHNNFGKKHSDIVVKKLNESDIGSGEYKWRRTLAKIEKIANAMKDDLDELHKVGLYDDSQSIVVRDHAAEAIRARAVDLCNHGALYKESERLAKIAAEIAGTESYRNSLKNDELALGNVITQDKNSLLEIDLSGIFSKKFANFKSRFVDYRDTRVFYKDVTTISLSAIKDNYATTYYFWVDSYEGMISFSFRDIDTWNKLTDLCFRFIIPQLVAKLTDRIFTKGEKMEIGDVEVDKKGFTVNKSLGRSDFISWNDKVYVPQFQAGYIMLYKEENGKVKSAGIVKMSVGNAIILPALLKACVERAYALGICTVKDEEKPKQGVSGTVPDSSASGMPPDGSNTWDEYYEKIDRAQRPELLKDFEKNGGKRLSTGEITALKKIKETGNIQNPIEYVVTSLSNHYNIDEDTIAKLIAKGYIRKEKGILSAKLIIEKKGFGILNWVYYKYK